MIARNRDVDNVFRFLSGIAIFKKWTVESLEKLSNEVTFEKIKEGGVIYHKGDIPSYLYIVISGAIQENCSLENGDEILLDTYVPKEIFGEVGFFDGRSRETIVQARKISEVLKISRDGLIESLSLINKDSWLDLTAFLCSRRRKSLVLVNELLSRGSEYRITSIILKLFNTSPESSQFEITYDELATLSGLSRITIHKVIKSMERNKMIIKKRSSIEIINKKKIEEFLDDH